MHFFRRPHDERVIFVPRVCCESSRGAVGGARRAGEWAAGVGCAGGLIRTMIAGFGGVKELLRTWVLRWRWGEGVPAKLRRGDLGRGARGVVPGLSLGAGRGVWGQGRGFGVVSRFALAMRCRLDVVICVEDVAVQDRL